MSNVSVAKKQKKKIRLSLEDKTNKSTLERRKQQLNVKSTNSNVFETENFPNEERDENLEIFHQKGMKKSSLPSISALLSTSIKDSGISSLLNNSIEKPQRTRIQEYHQNGDIFVSKVPNSMGNPNEQFDEVTSSSPLNRNYKKTHDYSISDMFSDGLSQSDNSNREFSYVSSSAESGVDLVPLAMTIDVRKTDSKSNLLGASFGRKKQRKETPHSSRLGDSLKLNKESEKKKAMNESSTTFGSSGKKDSRMTSLLYNNPINELRNYDKNGEPCIVCRAESLTASPMHRVCQKTKEHSTSDMLDLGNSPLEMKYDVDFPEFESDTVDIALSVCNLDYKANSDDLTDESIKMINEKALWYLDEHNLTANAPDSITEDKSILCDNTMNYIVDKNLKLSDLLRNRDNFIEKDSVIESAEAINASQDSCQASDSIIELSNPGFPLSGLSNISVASYDPKFDFLQKYRISLEEKDVIQPESRASGFGISQAMYVKQRSPFFNLKKTKNKKPASFELNLRASKEVEEFRPEVHLSTREKHNYASKYRYDDSDKENEGQVSYPQMRRTGREEFGKEFRDLNAKRRASSNSINKSLKRRCPFDENIEFSNIEMNDNRNICQGKKRLTAKNVDGVQDTGSENQRISIDQISSSRSNASNISDDISMSSSQSSFWRLSHEVQNFVKEWLDKENGIDCKSSKKKLSPKRRQLNVNSGDREEGVDIDPEMLLSNHFCEYDKT